MFSCISCFLWPLLIVSAYGGAVNFALCRDVQATGIVSNVIIPSCNALPCTFNRGNNYTIEIDFEANKNTDSLAVEVFGLVQGIQFPWPGLDTDGCGHISVGWCPLYSGDYVTYEMPMVVDPFYPIVDPTLRWLIKGDDGLPIFCFEIPIHVR